jgi:hypothetical protein
MRSAECLTRRREDAEVDVGTWKGIARVVGLSMLLLALAGGTGLLEFRVLIKPFSHNKGKAF